MMVGLGRAVNARGVSRAAGGWHLALLILQKHRPKLSRKKKPGSKEPGLRQWPREADTITFQEGLLSVRATGGGGQMRNAIAQRENIMVRASTAQQPPGKHVSHAETEGGAAV
jgi:hypothetical protein